MRIDVISLFPEYFDGVLGCGIVRIAQSAGRLQMTIVNPRDFTDDPHRTADDYPFGGGPGMVLRPEPIHHALASVRSRNAHIVMMSPRGRTFSQSTAERFSRMEHIILICGRYKGIDERIRAECDDEVSLGDFVLSGGEAAAAVITEAVVRLLPGVVGDAESVDTDSFTSGLLDCPHYTRPATFEGRNVPEQVLTGDHAAVAAWRRRQSISATAKRHPQLLRNTVLTATERDALCLEIQKES